MSSPGTGFTHLHVHSHFTLLGGTPSVEGLAARAAADGMTHLALTDTHALYGAVAFVRACAAVGVTPIIGMTAQIQAATDENAPRAGRVDGAPDQVVLLATGPAGYRSLCRLSSLLQADPAREEALRRGLTWTDLKTHREGLLCLAGGRRSRFTRALRRGDQAEATRYLAQVAGIFDDSAYLALELHTEDDEQLVQESVALGARFGFIPVAVQPVYCLNVEERSRLRLLAAIDGNCRLEQLEPAATPDDGDASVNLHWLSQEGMARRFRAFPDALAAVADVTARCHPALPDGRPIWPELGLPADVTPEFALAAQVRDGVAFRYPESGDSGLAAKIEARLQAELSMINRQGFAPLFLLVADIVAFARRRQIPVSTRGSVANSLAAYCLGITTVDPTEHGLLFERFLNPARATPPDIDLDFCSARRDEVLHYVRDKFGEERVALLATVSTMGPKSAVRETAKAYGASEEMTARLLKRLPDRWHPDPRRRVAGTLEDLLADLHTGQERAIARDAFAILGQPHHLSIHPGGLVVTPGPTTDYFPVQWTPKGFLISQFAHEDMDALGLPKMDLLGIRALTVLADAAKLVRRHYDRDFRLEAIPPQDTQTGALLAVGDTVGVFQCDSNGARRTLRQLQARTVRDLAVANAFFKPGPATGGMAGSFIRRYRGEEKADYLHPALTPILAATQGVLLFQEQILRVGVDIAGLSWEEADHLRRGMSKFDAQAMEALTARFVVGCQRPPPDGPGLSADQARRLWEQVRAFAGYGFNQGHATAYADVSYRSAYLKAHWPAAFFAARLANYGGFHHPAIYVAEAKRRGIAVRPPHINHSNARFTLRFAPASDAPQGETQPVLWMGLGQVSHLRRRAIDQTIAAREAAPFAGVGDLLQRVDLQRKEVLHLIQCGGLDGLAPHRAALLAEAASLLDAPILRAGEPDGLQLTFDFGADELWNAARAEEREPVAPESRRDRLQWEQAILGFPVSVHPLQTVPCAVLDGAIGLEEVARRTGKRVNVGAFRLPGWTGGPGCFIGDGRTFCTARLPRHMRPLTTWAPVLLTGHWAEDEWGSGWLQVEQATPLR